MIFTFLKGNTLTFQKIIVPLLNFILDLVYKMHTHTYNCQKFLENVQLSEVFFVLWTVSFIITKIKIEIK